VILIPVLPPSKETAIFSETQALIRSCTKCEGLGESQLEADWVIIFFFQQVGSQFTICVLSPPWDSELEKKKQEREEEEEGMFRRREN
jgi:hypothetical protein